MDFSALAGLASPVPRDGTAGKADSGEGIGPGVFGRIVSGEGAAGRPALADGASPAVHTHGSTGQSASAPPAFPPRAAVAVAAAGKTIAQHGLALRADHAAPGVPDVPPMRAPLAAPAAPEVAAAGADRAQVSGPPERAAVGDRSAEPDTDQTFEAAPRPASLMEPIPQATVGAGLSPVANEEMRAHVPAGDAPDPEQIARSGDGSAAVTADRRLGPDASPASPAAPFASAAAPQGGSGADDPAPVPKTASGPAGHDHPEASARPETAGGPALTSQSADGRPVDRPVEWPVSRPVPPAHDAAQVGERAAAGAGPDDRPSSPAPPPRAEPASGAADRSADRGHAAQAPETTVRPPNAVGTVAADAVIEATGSAAIPVADANAGAMGEDRRADVPMPRGDRGRPETVPGRPDLPPQAAERVGRTPAAAVRAEPVPARGWTRDDTVSEPVPASTPPSPPASAAPTAPTGAQAPSASPAFGLGQVQAAQASAIALAADDTDADGRDLTEELRLHDERPAEASRSAAAQTSRTGELPRTAMLQVIEMIRAGETSVEVTLDPQELGRLSLTLGAEDGTMTVYLSAERPDTADLMRRNIDILLEEAREAGFTDIAFEFAGDGGANDGGAGDRSDPGPAATRADAPSQLSAARADQARDLAARLAGVPSLGDRSLDIRL